MKLIIHCGLHKTATSSFQEFCAQNRALLRSFGIHYPTYEDKNQHSYLLWEAQRRSIKVLGSYLEKVFHEAREDCHSVLLSGEDFENCIVDLALASEIESLSREAGFTSLEWVVVFRPLNDAIKSLYAEMSKHGVVLSLDIIQTAAKERGCFYVSSRNFNYIFVLDYSRFSESFQRHVLGNFLELEMKDFVSDFPGSVLLHKLLSKNAFRQFCEAAEKSETFANKSSGSLKVELRYLFTALGLSKRRRMIFAPLLAPLLVPLIWLRLTAKRQVEKASQ